MRDVAQPTVSNSIVWSIALGPLLFAVIFAGVATAYLNHRVQILLLCLLGFVLASLMALADMRYLSRQGKDISGLTFVAAFIVPAYLFMRAERVQGSNIYAWVFLAALLTWPSLAAAITMRLFG